MPRGRPAGRLRFARNPNRSTVNAVSQRAARVTGGHPAGYIPVMRGLLVVNPKATTTSARTRDVLAGALRSEMELTVGFTRRRGHGFDLARDAAAGGVDVVVALGGDGTVNEV